MMDGGTASWQFRDRRKASRRAFELRGGMDYTDFFRSAMGRRDIDPFPYQRRLAEAAWPETLVIPTGFGKTAAVLGAWLWKIAQDDAKTPLRLVYCLPMRTLVEQTERVAKIWTDAARETLGKETELDVLMGGYGDGRRSLPRWMLEADRPAILIGTQDLLVSAALMRGYGASRYRWPVDFALLHNDALWVFDEVQLAGATLATSAQLEAFRRRFGHGRHCRTLWMSATLDPAWLRTVDFTPADEYRGHDLSEADLARAEHLWLAGKRLKRLELISLNLGKQEEVKAYATALTRAAVEEAKRGNNTIIFLNTVVRAQAVFDALNKTPYEGEIILVHSRFRKFDRSRLAERMRAPAPAQGRIIVTTQALEAGVDVSSGTMITEIAPWSSLVQRIGRCNRYGECGEAGAEVYWVDLSDADAKPYEPGDFVEAREKLASVSACGPSDLAKIRPSAPPRGAVIRKRDLFDLFDTDPDLSGFDVDVSLYVRDADDTDVRLFWRSVEDDAPSPDAPAPSRDELCPAPIGGARKLLERKDMRAWLWDALAREWRRTGKAELFPGLTIWVDAVSGGYDAERGFDPSAKSAVVPLSVPDVPEASMDDDPDSRTSSVRVSLAKHSGHVRAEAALLADTLGLEDAERDAIVEAGLWHDLGKAHEAFVALTASALTEDVKPPLAKWPTTRGGRADGSRRYFRHELASALAYLATSEWADDAGLVAYLIAAHHGKVRMRMRALPKEPHPAAGRLFARGVWDGDALPATRLDDVVIPAMTLNLDLMQLGDGPCGPSWSSRTQGLLRRYGPFRLAWLEALVRIADWRASAAEEAAGHDDI